jgi:hypothetical protein
MYSRSASLDCVPIRGSAADLNPVRSTTFDRTLSGSSSSIAASVRSETATALVLNRYQRAVKAVLDRHHSFSELQLISFVRQWFPDIPDYEVRPLVAGAVFGAQRAAQHHVTAELNAKSLDPKKQILASEAQCAISFWNTGFADEPLVPETALPLRTSAVASFVASSGSNTVTTVLSGHVPSIVDRHLPVSLEASGVDYDDLEEALTQSGDLTDFTGDTAGGPLFGHTTAPPDLFTATDLTDSSTLVQRCATAPLFSSPVASSTHLVPSSSAAPTIPPGTSVSQASTASTLGSSTTGTSVTSVSPASDVRSSKGSGKLALPFLPIDPLLLRRPTVVITPISGTITVSSSAMSTADPRYVASVPTVSDLKKVKRSGGHKGPRIRAASACSPTRLTSGSGGLSPVVYRPESTFETLPVSRSYIDLTDSTPPVEGLVLSRSVSTSLSTVVSSVSVTRSDDSLPAGPRICIPQTSETNVGTAVTSILPAQAGIIRAASSSI